MIIISSFIVRISMKSNIYFVLVLFSVGITTGYNLNAQDVIPDKLPPHPRILFKKSDISGIREKISTNKWAENEFNSLKRNADSWLTRQVRLPDRGGQWYHYYSCPEHGARLRTESPTRHVCPVDGKVFTGYPYDDVVIMSEHNGFANALKTLGIIYQLTGEKKYALKAKEILLAYAEKYRSYPLHNIHGEPKIGGGKVGPQTLDESTWLITMVEGADCIWETLTQDEVRKVTEGLFIPATDVIRQHKMGIHNIQCWKNSAVGMTGLLLGNTEILKEALHGEVGYFNQMKKGVMNDGAWYEGAWGYHFYTVSALLHFTEACHNCGINLYIEELKKMFDAPISMAMPNLDLPPFNDSGTVNLPSMASLYEVAFARFKDNRYWLVIDSADRSNLNALLYGQEFIGGKPVFLINSTNYPDSGYAILSAGKGINSTWFCMDYGPHGGGHGHPDKLSFVFYSKGEVLAPDPGTANYGVPIQANWFRTSIAHNTLTVDETSQLPAQGSCLSFISDRDFSAVLSHAGKIYSDVDFYRASALFGEDLLVIADTIKCSRQHILDVAYHQNGVFIEQPGMTLEKLSDKPGYNQLRSIRTFKTNDFVKVMFLSPKKNKVTWMLAGGKDTQILTGTGVGKHTEDRVPVVIARRSSKNTAFIHAVLLGEEPANNFITAYPIEYSGGTQIPPVAVKFTLKGKTFILISNPTATDYKIGNQRGNQLLAVFVLNHKGEPEFLKDSK